MFTPPSVVPTRGPGRQLFVGPRLRRAGLLSYKTPPIPLSLPSYAHLYIHAICIVHSISSLLLTIPKHETWHTPRMTPSAPVRLLDTLSRTLSRMRLCTVCIRRSSRTINQCTLGPRTQTCARLSSICSSRDADRHNSPVMPAEACTGPLSTLNALLVNMAEVCPHTLTSAMNI